MIITFVSVFLNHHQLMLCKALKERCDEFYFISTSRIVSERLNLGYKELDYEYDFVVRTYDENFDEKRLYDILSKSDAVIFGDCPNSLLEYRMNLNKLSFLFSERLYKKGVIRRFYPPTREKVKNRILRFKDKELYVLCASGFLAWDLALSGFPTQKCYKWGYFPYVDCPDQYPLRNNLKLKILWAGRMIDCKRADSALKVCRKLKKSGVDFQLDFIGDGDKANKLKKLTQRYKMENNVRFLGSMPSEKVREAMLEADVFLFTSDFREGWGAVLNEAMSCGCAVLASSAVGSVPFLIEDGKNGLIYKYGSQSDFYKKLKILAENKEMRESLGKNAVATICNEYSADTAAERLVEFIQSKDKETCSYERGPMSSAEIIRNNWYRK